MRTYRIVNRGTWERRDVQAQSARAACRQCGWPMARCYVRELGSAQTTALAAVRQASAALALAALAGEADVVEVERLERAVYRAAWRALQAGCRFDDVHGAQVAAAVA